MLKRTVELQATELLEGKIVKECRYMTDDELEQSGWDDSPMVIFFTDGTYIMPQSDDEGNAGGALYTSSEDMQVIGTWRS